MDVFISWSGERSRAAAEALRGWLPKIINAIKPWLSSADIAQGTRWGTDVASRLESARAGIICLTPDNLHADWILFEAGALSKTLQNTFVCPFLIGLEPSDVKPPLAQFQATRAQRDDVLKLLKTLNAALRENALPDAHIEEAFEVWWPKLDAQLKALPAQDSRMKTHRPDRELLEEVLALVRNQNRLPSARDSYEYVRDRAVAEEAERIANSLLVDDEVAGWQIKKQDEAYEYQLRTSKRKTYSLTLPFDTPFDQLRARIIAQLASQVAAAAATDTAQASRSPEKSS